jgi:hypothetical protein
VASPDIPYFESLTERLSFYGLLPSLLIDTAKPINNCQLYGENPYFKVHTNRKQAETLFEL